MVTSGASAQTDRQIANSIPPAPLNEQYLQLRGDPDRPAMLVVTLFMPNGNGPFPLAVMNHGASGSKEHPSQAQRYRFTMSAYYFLSRGYAVALPMMRGFAGSEGRQENHGCDVAALALHNGRDIEAVIDNLRGDARLDTSRVVVAGQSFGGWNTLGYGALGVRQNVRALVNFVGGVETSSCDDTQSSLISAAGSLGARTRIPSLWFYGENDSLFGPEIWRPMHHAYVAGGASAQLVDVGRFMEDSHQMLSRPESLPIWTPALDAFLSRNGLPGREIYPRYLPMPWPKPSHSAALDDVSALPWVNARSREVYQHFLDTPPPRVFVVSPGGQSVATNGGFDPLARALGLCQGAHITCFPYAIDDDVVFISPPAVNRPGSTKFAQLDNVGAVPWINDKGRDTYRAFLAHSAPRAFLIGNGGESVATYGPPDPLSRAMTLCANAHIVCRPYALDDNVVWKPPPPAAVPPATNFAALANVAAVPWVNPGSRNLYARFLTLPLPRAFVVAPGGQAAVANGGYDPLGRILARCRSVNLDCRPYAVDNDVVWVPPKS